MYDIPNPVPNFDVTVGSIPETDDIFTLPHTDGTPADFGPIRPTSWVTAIFPAA